MKKLKIALLVSGIVCVGTAQAEFSGFSVGVGGSLVHSKIEYDSENLLRPSSFRTTDNKSNIFLDLSYGLNITNNIITTFGTTYAFNKVNSGGAIIQEPSGVLLSLESKLKDRYSLYVAPGYLLTEDILLYGKLAYHSAKTELSGTYFDGKKLNKTHNGFGIGAGYSFAFENNVELDLEVQHILYNKKSRTVYAGKIDTKPTATEYSIKFKYRF